MAAELPIVRDLERDVREAGRRGIPLLVFFAADSCPYCHEVEELYLEPMHMEGYYAGRLMMRVVRIESQYTMRDFTGDDTDHGSFAHNHGVFLTPVVRFYGPSGKELVPELIGYTTPDFYGGYLQDAIDQAIAALQPSATRTAVSLYKSRRTTQ
jgi:thioredoxin-related protein